MVRTLGIAFSAVASTALVFAAEGRAQSRCAALQYKASGAAARQAAVCAAKAAATGASVDAACLAAAERRLAKRWGKAVGFGDCPTPADAGAAAGVVSSFLGALDGLLVPLANCCVAAGSCYGGPNLDASGCAELLGTLGPPGSVCDGTGSCVLPPAAGGPCCTLASLSVCTAMPAGDQQQCEAAGGVFSANAVCQPNGACTAP